MYSTYEYLQVATEFTSCYALQISEAALVKTKSLADKALRLVNASRKCSVVMI